MHDEHIRTEKATVVFFGDSRAEQWPFPREVTGCTFVNRGIGGQTSAQSLSRFAHHVLPLHPDILLVQVGVNDLWSIAVLADDENFMLAACKQNIREIVNQAAASGATVIITTIFPVGMPAFIQNQHLDWLYTIGQAILDVNAMIRTLAAPNVIVFDAYSLLEEDGLVRELFVEDWLHINMSGYAALNAALVPILLEVGAKKQAEP